MLKKIYYLLHRLLSRPEERGTCSGGYWQACVRTEALFLCRGIKGRLLEVGCGEGLFLAQLAQENPELQLWGIDNNRQRIAEVNIRLEGKNVHLTVEDATQLSFAPEYFDAVVCINVLLNLPNLELLQKALAEIARVCKKGGRVIFDFRNARNPFLVLKYRLAPWYDPSVKNLPLNSYKIEQFQEMCRPLNLNIKQTIPVGSHWKRWAPIIVIEAEKR